MLGLLVDEREIGSERVWVRVGGEWWGPVVGGWVGGCFRGSSRNPAGAKAEPSKCLLMFHGRRG